MNYFDYRSRLEKNAEYRAAVERLRSEFTLGDAILMARLRKKWSQTELAHRVGTKQANISRIEDGLANPTLDLIKRLFAALELDIRIVDKVGTTTQTAIYNIEEATIYAAPSWLRVVSKSSDSIGEIK